MLSGSSFNALLKTLEEPPEHVKFVFCTTEPQKVPTTIISRCQRFDLRRLSTRDILDHLAKIAAEEKIDVEPDALLAIARGADGALRDAESALDQLIGFRGTHIGEDDVLAVFGLVARQVLEDLAGAVLGGDLRTAVQLVHEMDGAGKDLQRLTIELLGYFRSLLILAAAGAEAVGEDLAASQLETMTAHLRASTPSQILRIVDVLTEAEGRMRFALSRRTLLEVALIRCAQIATSVSIEGVLAQLDSLKKAVAGAAAPQTAYVAPADTPSSGVRELKAEAPSTPPRAEATGVGGLAELQSAWPKIVEQVGRAAPLAQSSLAGARPLRVDGRQVVVALDPTFCESLDKLDFPRNRKALQKAIGDVLQREVAVELVLEGGDKKEEAAKQSEAPSKESRRRPTKSRQEWIRDPAVKKTLEAFNGDIQDIH